MEAKKTFTIYYKDQSSEIVVYQGVPQNEIVTSIKQIFNIEDSKQLSYLEEDGKPIVISSYLPNEIKIFVQEILPLTSSIVQDNNKKFDHWIINSTMIVLSRTSFKTQDMSTTYSYGNVNWTSGKYYWRIKIEHLHCCQDVGICSTDIQKGHTYNYEKKDQLILKGLPGILPNRGSGPQNTGCSSLDIKDHIFGFYANVDEKKFLIVNETTHEVYRKTKFNFPQIIPFVKSMKHKNIFELILNNDPIPSWVEQEYQLDTFEEPVINYPSQD